MAYRKTSIGFRLRKARTLQGLSIRQVAKKVHISPIRLSHWERNIRKPSIDSIVLLAVVYQVMVDELLFDLRQDAVRTMHGTPDNPYGDYYKNRRERPP